MSFLERYTMNITAFMISYHHSVPVFPIYDPRAILLNYLGVH